MKKLLLVLAIGAFAACNNSSGDAKASDTATKAADTSASKAMDTVKASADTSAHKMDTTAKKDTSAKK